nr:MAG TPA: hypothetical protein [Caudoviricetes sp.]
MPETNFRPLLPLPLKWWREQRRLLRRDLPRWEKRR